MITQLTAHAAITSHEEFAHTQREGNLDAFPEVPEVPEGYFSNVYVNIDKHSKGIFPLLGSTILIGYVGLRDEFVLTLPNPVRSLSCYLIIFVAPLVSFLLQDYFFNKFQSKTNT